MRKIGTIIFIIIVLAGAGYFFRKSVPASSNSRIQLAVSGYVPYTLAKQIGGDWAEISMLLPPGAEPHAFEPTPGSMVLVHRADAFVYISDWLEPWVKDILGAAGKKTRIVSLAQGINLGDDPHVWMDFGAVRTMAHKLVELLIELDPAHQEGYLANWHRFEAEIEALEKSFSKQLADCQSREVVHVGHLAFSLLAKRYQLTLFALAGTSHDGEHSARKLADLVKLIRQRKIRALFTEEAISPRLAEAVAAETEADILPLYTVEHVTKNDFDHAVTYSQLMQRNLDSLTRGLVCARS